MSRRSLLAAAVATALLLLLPAAAIAHPLGNFTINHYTGIRVAPDVLLLDHVLDMAEIPAFQERQRIDVDGDGTLSVAEIAAYRQATCIATAQQLQLVDGGTRVPLQLVTSGLSFPAGQGGLSTLRLVCEYRAALASPLAPGASFTFLDPTYAERIGWREIVVQGDGVTLTASSAPTSATSARLTAYPQDLLSQPMALEQAAFSAAPGGPRLPTFQAPDAIPPADGATSASATSPENATPGGSTDLGGQVTAILQARDLTPPLIVLSLLIAAGLGALHAVSPGHGKTVMAAYLVGSRGGVRHALGLGLTVTLAHTLGVLLLGALTVFAASLITPERLYPALGLISGWIVVVIGSVLVAMRGRELWRARLARLSDRHVHDVGEHGHEQGDGRHEHEGSTDDHVTSDGLDSWHAHGGLRHTHLPATRVDSPLRWRGLFALGLSGGLVPSASALLLLIGSVTLGRPVYGLALTIAFGLGMAVVLVSVGLLLVSARGFVARLPSRARFERLGRAMPIATALIVLGFGVLITVEAATQVRF